MRVEAARGQANFGCESDRIPIKNWVIYLVIVEVTHNFFTYIYNYIS